MGIRSRVAYPCRIPGCTKESFGRCACKRGVCGDHGAPCRWCGRDFCHACAEAHAASCKVRLDEEREHRAVMAAWAPTPQPQKRDLGSELQRSLLLEKGA
ncbi:MAG: hypothetical protein MUF54_01545 [Polyangiaceae bacterium]|jgi:hypothetical protein|nr:hypothetical protein [Polyangiaceae bacterium]